MTKITYKNQKLSLKEDQTVLNALLEGGYSISHACEQGVCQSCILKASPSNDLPKTSQIGLKSTQQEQGYFLSCLCKPTTDLEITDAEDLGVKFQGEIISTLKLTPSVYALRLKIEGDFPYKAGQYINLIRPSDQTIRSYSLASIYDKNSYQQKYTEIELHIKAFPGGEMSSWLCSDIKAPTQITGPMGDCFYSSSFKGNDLLLLGWGTGLAPLYGILQEALSSGHKGNIHLYHWGNEPEDLYFQKEINIITDQNSHVFYKAGLQCENKIKNLKNLMFGDACALIQKEIPSLKDWKIFLCGSEAKVNKARRIFYLSGADLSDIYADAFFTWQIPESTPKEEKITG